jgi:hypothetical protein
MADTFSTPATNSWQKKCRFMADIQTLKTLIEHQQKWPIDGNTTWFQAVCMAYATWHSPCNISFEPDEKLDTNQAIQPLGELP